MGLSRELSCSCLRELAILSLEEVAQTPGLWGRRHLRWRGQGQLLFCPTTDHTLLCLCGRFQAPVLSKLPSSFLQYLKVGGTSVKHPVTPSFLTAQGKWR